jgi:ubiquinone/menaquinone biosynthesis C-methylase UbiE
LERLRFQHQAWVEHAYALWARADLRAGHVVLDLGCGPGYTSLELAHIVGPKGRVIARDVSNRFLVFLRSECRRLGCSQVRPSLGPVEELQPEPGSLDAAYARWLFCWLEDPGAVMAIVAHGLKPGGMLILQDYLDWGAMKRIPTSEVFARAVEACMESWPLAGGTIDIGEHVLELAQRSGLRVEHFQPVARLGGVGSLEWRWLGDFFRSYLPKLVDKGLLTAAELSAFRADWQSAAQDEVGTYIQTPTMVDVILRKP